MGTALWLLLRKDNPYFAAEMLRKSNEKMIVKRYL